MEDLSFEDIEGLDDIGEIFDVATKYDIPLDGCDSCEDFVERITLHKQKLTKYHKQLLDPQRYENLKIENKQKREAICSIFKSVQTNLEGSYDLLNKILQSNGITSDLSRDLTDHLKSLNDGDCNIVIAGQTSAGKSTLLNLLLGMDLLPKHILSCTSSICKIRYGAKFKVKVIKGSEVREQELKNLEETTSHLENLVAEKEFSRRASGEIIPEVEIYAPSSILKCGVTIVDTPGFGEYESMDNLVKNFINERRVAAFVYVIKTDSAGGVQEDRLVRFLKTFLENKDQHEHSFNPRAALFVCNRWDMIDDNDKPEVKRNVLEKLKDVWPSLHEGQVCFFSTTRAKASLNVDKYYITKQLHHLLVSLNSLFVVAHQDVIKKSYGWLKNVMKECTIYLQTILSQLTMTEIEHEEKFQKARKQLEILRSKADDVMEELRMELELASNTMLKKFRQILSSEDFERQVTDWDISEVPPLPTTVKEFENLKEEVDGIIVNRIFRFLDAREDCSVYICQLRKRMMLKIRNQLQILDDDMEEFAFALSGGSVRSSSSSDSSAGSDDEDTIVAEIKYRREAKSLSKKILNFVKVGEGTKGINPRAFICRTIAPLLCKATEKVETRRLNERRRSSQVNPKQFVEERSKKVLDMITNKEDLLRRFVLRYTEKLVRQINSISKKIPQFIQANMTLMNEITVYRLEGIARENRHQLKKAIERLEPQKELLRGFGYLHVKDFSSDDVLLSINDPRINSSTKVRVDMFLHSSQADAASKRDAAQGLWAVVQKAELTIDQEKVPIMVKYYINKLEDQQMFQEVAKLRCLGHSSIATFLGMTHTETQSAFVFNDHLTSARRYLRRATTNIRKSVPLILTELTRGLEFIHREELVHMELSLDTVMVNADGKVKLCNMCLPRKCKFPSDIDVIDAADFTCLSPKVLRGGVYNSSADMYSFGVLVYELMMQKKPFEDERSMKLSKFIQNVNPSTMLKLDGEMSEPLSELLRGCLLRDETTRMNICTAKDIIQRLVDDPELSNFKCLKEAIRKSCSMPESRSRRIPKRTSRSASEETALTVADSQHIQRIAECNEKMSMKF